MAARRPGVPEALTFARVARLAGIIGIALPISIFRRPAGSVDLFAEKVTVALSLYRAAVGKSTVTGKYSWLSRTEIPEQVGNPSHDTGMVCLLE
jgi:hypothetical protein